MDPFVRFFGEPHEDDDEDYLGDGADEIPSEDGDDQLEEHSDSEVDSAELGADDHLGLENTGFPLDPRLGLQNPRMQLQGLPHQAGVIRFITDLFDRQPTQPEHLPGVAPAEIPLLRTFRRHRTELDDYALATKKYFTSSMDMLRSVEASRDDSSLSSELKAALEKRKTSQAVIHKMMAEYLDLILAERAELMDVIDLVRPTSLSAFNKKWLPHIEDTKRRVRLELAAPLSVCIICADTDANGVLRRSCANNDLHFNCEGQACSCGAIMCVTCLVHHFWNQSEESTKSYARCPHCRAEYCPMDIRMVDVVLAPASVVAQPKAFVPSSLAARPVKRPRATATEQGIPETEIELPAAATMAPTQKRPNRRRR